jgi:hypothetical protein
VRQLCAVLISADPPAFLAGTPELETMMWRRPCLIVALMAQWPAAQAVELTYSLIDERLSTDNIFAIAGGNGSGPIAGMVKSGAALSFSDTVDGQAVDNNEIQNTSAVGYGMAAQTTVLGPLGARSDSNFLNGVAVIGSGTARTEATAELKTTFFTDVDVAYTLQTSVACDGDECESFVSLYGASSTILDLHTTAGTSSRTISGTFLAHQPYSLWAWTGSVSALNADASLVSSGSYTLNLALDAGSAGLVPEPSAALLLGVGLAGVTAARRGRWRVRT